MNENLDKLVTESVNEKTTNIDQLDTIGILKMINEEDRKVAKAVEKELPNISKAVDIISDRLKENGRLIYIGAGTSGRLGILDASECPPTFGVDSDMVIGLIAGGDKAIRDAVEGAEDSKEEAIKQLKGIAFNAKDVLVGIAASGRTPYVIGGLEYAKEIKVPTIAVTCNSASEISNIADISIAPVVGPEVISGSTRMKAGTAQKMVLNMLTTSTMVKLGKVYRNLMVDVQAKNLKLIERCKKIVMKVTEVDEDIATKYLEKTDYNVKLAIFIIKSGLELEKAKEVLNENDGHLSRALMYI
ncbi:N-acetylmuramic acid 6-phosphate etherase [Clostridium sp. D2Q-14]|uniref:N-acetylmuramic acid 6-phosphate etherase n=1 Tax=Anaeromonas gelatinilytica TaxID=2683194 RepID=UPI00193BAE9B|nr:N-acetylmuramic acid 6-phosphate etherase [Anaeromonas gelatinilytica]MBS4535263.1 N-acetylmuramic acid 6-phosphate etherase [Anaeromonas gelatinilytica]